MLKKQGFVEREKMKLLTQEELGGIDSTSLTIEKWDKFLKKAVWNLGYRQSLIDNMYPYEKGIPLKGGGTMPVSKKTGRVFFKMSWADKLCGVLSTLNNSSANLPQLWAIRYVLLCLWTKDFETFKKFFPDETEQTYEDLYREADVDSGSLPDMSGEYFGETQERLFEKFIDESDIFYSNIQQQRSNIYTRWFEGYLSDEQKEYLKLADEDCYGESNSVLFFYNKTLENEFSSFPKDRMLIAFNKVAYGYNALTKIKNYNEVYLQDYLVISLNPIDKLMCSTKQAFSSCMSIAKQDDTRGTYSAPALGLPSIFPTDAIYMVFMTPGKHKNMYWESEEWKKDPSERDKEKAYKYLKMTCRSLTYKGTMVDGIIDFLSKINKSKKDLIEKIEADKPRLYIGRQYSTYGEDFIWQSMIEVLLARQGISTSLGYANEIKDLKDELAEGSEAEIPRTADGISSFSTVKWFKSGKMTDHKFICTDRYGFLRGIYYDNLTISYSTEYINQRGPSGKISDIEYPACPVEKGGNHLIATGSTRYGTHGVHNWSVSSDTDMFKIMTGKMTYAQMNTSIKICSECGEVLQSGDYNRLPNGEYICAKCYEKEGYSTCEVCGEIHKDKKEHEIYNIRELTNPNNWQEFEPVYICRKQLKECAVGSEGLYFICAHCGKIERNTYYGHSGLIPAKAEFKGLEIKITLCNKCLAKAVMCDKCKRVLFLDSVADACLLLPNRRVICPDCIDSIRLKQEKRKILKEVLANKELSDFSVSPIDSKEIKDIAGRALDEAGIRIGTPSTLIKDAVKQIISYLQAHPDKTFPKLKSQNPLLEEENEERILV